MRPGVDADLVSRVRRRIVEADGDLDALVRAETRGIVDASTLAALRDEVDAELAGAGPLQPLLDLPGVTDVLVNAPDAVWIERYGTLHRVPVGFADDRAVRRLAQRLANTAGRRLDDAQPFVDAALPDGTRLHAVLPPLSGCTTVCLRVLTRQRLGYDDLTACGAIPAGADPLLRALIEARLACVITGGTGVGKTTLLGALLGLIAPSERIVLVEDTGELVTAHPHVVGLVTRPANVEGAGAIDLRDLVRQALRMRPDRLIVGELRGAEMVDLLVALNTGHDGGAATLHANSAADVPARLAALGALAGLPMAAVTSLAAAALQVIVHLRRVRDGTRQVTDIGLLHRDGDRLVVRPLWSAAAGRDRAGADGWTALLASRALPTLGGER